MNVDEVPIVGRGPILPDLVGPRRPCHEGVHALAVKKIACPIASGLCHEHPGDSRDDVMALGAPRGNRGRTREPERGGRNGDGRDDARLHETCVLRADHSSPIER